jgi:enamine deaminase RidA (YjgF/YER057c/UK114 family)
MSKSANVAPKLAPPAGPFSPAVRADGYVFFSGRVAQDPAAPKPLVELLGAPRGAPRNDPQRGP